MNRKKSTGNFEEIKDSLADAIMNSKQLNAPRGESEIRRSTMIPA